MRWLALFALAACSNTTLPPPPDGNTAVVVPIPENGPPTCVPARFTDPTRECLVEVMWRSGDRTAVAACPVATADPCWTVDTNAPGCSGGSLISINWPGSGQPPQDLTSAQAICTPS